MSRRESRLATTEVAAAIEVRALRFEEVDAVLGLIRRAVEHGCRAHYDAVQRAAVFRTYATGLFAESLGPFLSVVASGAPNATAEGPRALLGFAQLDRESRRLRGLFVDAGAQGHGVGGELLAEIERRAISAGVKRLAGAMSLNAVPFYARAGFQPLGGPEPLMTSGVSVPVVRMEKRLENRPPAD